MRFCSIYHGNFSSSKRTREFTRSVISAFRSSSNFLSHVRASHRNSNATFAARETSYNIPPSAQYQCLSQDQSIKHTLPTLVQD